MKQPDGYDGYEGGADNEYWKNRNEQDDKRSPNKARRG